ncbi:MAG: hypothetical protein HUU32_21575 [Calditrichaceae bacterium]|nr:hypothetical protein [Calditrichaceae bacterium]
MFKDARRQILGKMGILPGSMQQRRTANLRLLLNIGLACKDFLEIVIVAGTFYIGNDSAVKERVIHYET